MEQPKWNWYMLLILKLLSDGKSKDKKEIIEHFSKNCDCLNKEWNLKIIKIWKIGLYL